MSQLLILGTQLFTDDWNRSFIKLEQNSFNKLNLLLNSYGYNPLDQDTNILKLKNGDVTFDDRFIAATIEVKTFCFQNRHTEDTIEGNSIRLIRMESSLEKPELIIN